ncbi:MAG: hypothetical protein NWF05_02840 [Candidatus Bathyarchaeota archaeon]|nr:hypothetical protein [Candidatus Bathyarchaeota archaeon]
MTEQKTIEIAAVNQQIEAINKRIGTLKEDLNKTHEDIKTFIEQRDQLNTKAQALRQEIGEIKKERDQLNVNVKNLKVQRDEVRKQMAPFIEEIKTHSQRIRDLKEKRSGGNRQELQKAFEALEFKIATTSMDLQDEKRLIDQVKEIETHLSIYKKMDQHSKKISAIKTELKVFQDKADVFHNALTENAKKSQELHAMMLSKFEEMNKIREEATNLHLKFLMAKEKIKPMHEEIGRCLEQRNKLFGVRQGQYAERQKQMEATKIENEKVKKAKEQEIKEKLGSAVREKLQRGEKLDWREFQLLAGDETETED